MKETRKTKKYGIYLVVGLGFLGFLQAVSQGSHLILELGQLSDLSVALLGYRSVFFKELTLPLLELLYSGLPPLSFLDLLRKRPLQIFADSQGVLKDLFPGLSLGLGAVLEDPPRSCSEEGTELKSRSKRLD